MSRVAWSGRNLEQSLLEIYLCQIEYQMGS